MKLVVYNSKSIFIKDKFKNSEIYLVRNRHQECMLMSFNVTFN